MRNVPIHTIRQADAHGKAKSVQHKRRPAKAADQAPTAESNADFIRRVNFPPGWKPHIDWGAPVNNGGGNTRANGGFDKHSLSLTGSGVHAARGPVKTMGKVAP